MNIESAAVALSDRIFGERRSFLRLGVVRASDGILHVYTHLAPARWPKDRVKSSDGFPVMWHWVPTAAAGAGTPRP
jgi:hypothetical protein